MGGKTSESSDDASGQGAPVSDSAGADSANAVDHAAADDLAASSNGAVDGVEEHPAVAEEDDSPWKGALKEFEAIPGFEAVAIRHRLLECLTYLPEAKKAAGSSRAGEALRQFEMFIKGE